MEYTDEQMRRVAEWLRWKPLSVPDIGIVTYQTNLPLYASSGASAVDLYDRFMSNECQPVMRDKILEVANGIQIKRSSPKASKKYSIYFTDIKFNGKKLGIMSLMGDSIAKIYLKFAVWYTEKLNEKSESPA